MWDLKLEKVGIWGERARGEVMRRKNKRPGAEETAVKTQRGVFTAS